MYKLRINASRKSDREAGWTDAAQWWKNFHEWYELADTPWDMNKYDYMLATYGASYHATPEWVLVFNNEEDATAFKLTYI